MPFVSTSNTVWKIRKKSDKKYYASLGRSDYCFTPDGGNISACEEDAEKLKERIEFNVDDLSYGDLEVVECAIVSKDILLILDE